MANDVFAVLADPTRRQLIDVLHRGEQAVNDLVDVVDIHQPGVSRHLRILHEAGLVKVRPDGQRRLYSLRREGLEDLDAWVQHYIHATGGRLDRLATALAKKPKVKP